MKMTKITKTTKVCSLCNGTGLEWPDGYATDCRECQGYGEVIESIKKEVFEDVEPKQYSN